MREATQSPEPAPAGALVVNADGLVHAPHMPFTRLADPPTLCGSSNMATTIDSDPAGVTCPRCIKLLAEPATLPVDGL